MTKHDAPTKKMASLDIKDLAPRGASDVVGGAARLSLAESSLRGFQDVSVVKFVDKSSAGLALHAGGPFTKAG